MFRQVLWSVVLSLTWCDGYLYPINTTDELVTDPVLMPVFDYSDLNSNVSFHAGNTTAMSTLEVQTAGQGNVPLNGDDNLASQCQVITQSQLTVIKSPSFPANYGPNLDCDYTVHRNSSNSCSVTFLFNVLDLETSEGCYKDYIDLNEEKLCGYVPSAGVTRIIQFQESEVVMKFHSDGDGSGLGFLLTAVQQECPSLSCDKNFTAPQFTLASPNFPSNYDNRRICDYVITKNSSFVCMLRLQVELFDVEYDDKCEADFFELGGEKFCGIMSEGQIVEMNFSDSEISGRFRSDYATSRAGFLFDVTQIECPQEVLFTNKSHVENSANFSESEPNENRILTQINMTSTNFTAGED